MRLNAIFLVLIFVLVKGSVLGCMCSPSSVSEAYSTARLVVIARVVKFEPVEIPETLTLADGTFRSITVNGQKVYLDISRWFKGSGKRDLMLVQPGSTCDWSFDDDDIGKEHLFYLYHDPQKGTYAIVPCGRSAEIRNAGDDLSWLRGLPKSLKRTRISGKSFATGDGFPPIGGLAITLTSGLRSYDLKTDSKGLYEIWDLAPGKYRLAAAAPDGFKLSWTSSVPDKWIFFWDPEYDPKALDVTLKANECAGVDFAFERKQTP